MSNTRMIIPKPLPIATPKKRNCRWFTIAHGNITASMWRRSPPRSPASRQFRHGMRLNTSGTTKNHSATGRVIVSATHARP